ncbi:hypothetical protein [Salinibacter sp.]|uniref:hypothetical protein n=1 Tax=Salinibacter sp. TaxID=2065818 RepID=UPI0021E79CEF|nr:hypothetical protein [Salinibacter sp.]
MEPEEVDVPDTPQSSRADPQSFGEWLSEPQTMIGLAAVLLSLCGLFVSIYETSLERQEQRASVWPRALVAPSLSGDSVKVIVENSGIGPARVRAAAVEHNGEHVAGWRAMMERLDIQGSVSTSLLNQRVLSPDSEIEVFAIRDSTRALSNSIWVGNLDITLCYCSVYEECWVTAMQNYVDIVVPDSVRDGDTDRGPQDPHRRVDGCGHIQPSGI